MDLATLQGMYGENFGVSGYKMMAAKPKLLMPQELPVPTLKRSKTPAKTKPRAQFQAQS